MGLKKPSCSTCATCGCNNNNGNSASSDQVVKDVDWDNLGFAFTPTDYMYVMKCCQGDTFSDGELQRFGNIELSPSAGILNYGQGLFEGLKAYRKQDGSILLFRPEENALRLRSGAERLCMPSPTIEQFLEAVKYTVLANERWVRKVTMHNFSYVVFLLDYFFWDIYREYLIERCAHQKVCFFFLFYLGWLDLFWQIPPAGKGSLYIRPLLIGSGSVLGVAPAPEFTFLVYASPVGNYFKEGLSPINLIVETNMHRASPGGTGGVKTVGNYAAVLKAQTEAKSKGYSDVLYLDSVHNKYVEEVSSCNVFVVKQNKICTPAIKGTILPGITRKSIIDIARGLGFQVEEGAVTVDELLEADEVFCTGTAVVVSPVGSITYLDQRVTYGKGGTGPVAQQLYSALTSLQMGVTGDKMDWIVRLN
ncbi:OLC1v1011389C1 [Oldenlandia corymbosa var. corymbosa]|uniref:Branched-chain-amino-acid aminotransferase n=1 Tax=Oldenlandia corymbosa var. corymbosa TaxID=529605 RepID=A0AAV1DTK2_OLDCO|nr:OLC1v1011389C1 [Oldenlandia corymbosa var. corymbosa]